MRKITGQNLLVSLLFLLAIAALVTSMVPAISAFGWLYVIGMESGWQATISHGPIHFLPFVLFPILQLVGLGFCIVWIRTDQPSRTLAVLSFQVLAVVGIFYWMISR